MPGSAGVASLGTLEPRNPRLTALGPPTLETMHDTVQAPRIPIGTELGKAYRVTRFLGAGAMGAVYEVEAPEGRTLAAKVFVRVSTATGEADAMARFLREIELSRTLDHPNVVRVVDSGLCSELGVPFFVMERVRGPNLEDLVDRLGALHPTVACRILLQACRGVKDAHDRGIVHRDIKPSNLLLQFETDDTVGVKVCDFGIAKWSFASGGLTHTGAVLGTPLYMAPEQALSARRVDARADVWSVGMTLYHALAGSAAFDRVGGMASLLVALANRSIRPLQELAPWIEPQLASVVHGALIGDPEARCPSISALMDALEPLCGASEPIRRHQLQPAPDKVRAQIAPRADLPRKWTDSFAETLSLGSVLPDPGERGDPLVGRVLRNDYRIRQLLGRGGMAIVYEATTRDGQPVAVKVMHATVTGIETRRRLLREAKALTEIDSPFVVRVVDVHAGPDDEAPFIVMELLRGTDLEHLVRKWGALSPAPAARLFVQACRGLAAAHRLGLVHRDVKPANIFVHQLPDGEIEPKVCDFGIAKRSLSSEGNDQTMELTGTGGFLGSPLYVSPEQAQSAKHVDFRTDIWSVGLAMWEALSGHRPWEEMNAVGELIVAICTKPVRPIRELAPWLDPGLAGVIERCLHKDPSLRWPSMDALADALEPYALPVERLHQSMLLPVSPEMRDTPAPDPPAVVAAQSARSRGRASNRWMLAGIAATALGAAAITAWSVRSGPAGDGAAMSASATGAAPSSPEPALGTASSTASLVRRVRLEVEPVDAAVFVEGEPRPVVDGGVWLEGQPGATLTVAAESGGRRIETKVTVTLDGPPVPDEIEVPAPEPGLATKPPATGTAPPAPPVASAAEPTSAPPAPPTATTAAPPVMPKDEWK